MASGVPVRASCCYTSFIHSQRPIPVAERSVTAVSRSTLNRPASAPPPSGNTGSTDYGPVGEPTPPVPAHLRTSSLRTILLSLGVRGLLENSVGPIDTGPLRAAERVGQHAGLKSTCHTRSPV